MVGEPGHASWSIEPDATEYSAGIDPYGQWLLTHGRRYLVGDDSDPDSPPLFGVIDHDSLEISVREDPNWGAGEVVTPLPVRRETIADTQPRETACCEPYSERGCGNPVIMVVIDDVMNIADGRLADGTGKTRVEFAWIQDGDAVPDGGVAFGREWTRSQIQALRDQHRGDDDTILRAMGLKNYQRPHGAPLDRRDSHGAHVLGLAGGAATDSADLRLICVALPQACTRETSGAFLGFYSVAALRYALGKARAIQSTLGQPVPVVVNFSYGITGGPHDGTHPVEALLNRVIDQLGGPEMPVTLVMPAGNSRLDRGHAAIAVATDSSFCLDLPWRLQPVDHTCNYLEIWVPQQVDDLALEINLPDGCSMPCPDLHAGHAWLVRHPNGQVIARITRDLRADRQRLLIATVPTDHTTRKRGEHLAPHGLWQIQVTGHSTCNAQVDAWIQRDTWPMRRDGQVRQAYFDDPAYERYSRNGFVVEDDTQQSVTSVVKRAGTVNGFATARGPRAPVVVGGIIGGATERQAPYSGLPDREQQITLLHAISERGRALPGVLSSGHRSGAVNMLGGTSFAAPQVARFIAEGYMAGALAVSDDARAWLLRTTANGSDTVRSGRSQDV